MTSPDPRSHTSPRSREAPDNRRSEGLPNYHSTTTKPLERIRPPRPNALSQPSQHGLGAQGSRLTQPVTTQPKLRGGGSNFPSESVYPPLGSDKDTSIPTSFPDASIGGGYENDKSMYCSTKSSISSISYTGTQLPHKEQSSSKEQTYLRGGYANGSFEDNEPHFSKTPTQSSQRPESIQPRSSLKRSSQTHPEGSTIRKKIRSVDLTSSTEEKQKNSTPYQINQETSKPTSPSISTLPKSNENKDAELTNKEKVIASLGEIYEKAKPFVNEIENFEELETSNKHYYIEESLRRLIEKLDDMFDDIEDDIYLREKRKEVYKFIFPLFEKLDDKVEENKKRLMVK